MLTSDDRIVEFFPQPIVTSIVVMPTYMTLVNRIYHICSNTASIQMTLCSSNICFLALTISLMVYTTLSATTFVKIPNPGPTPMIPPNTTGIQKTSIKYQINLETKIYMIHKNMDKDLKHQLLALCSL